MLFSLLGKKILWLWPTAASFFFRRGQFLLTVGEAGAGRRETASVCCLREVHQSAQEEMPLTGAVCAGGQP